MPCVTLIPGQTHVRVKTRLGKHNVIARVDGLT